MLPKQHRIPTNTLQSVFKTGRLFRSQCVVLYVQKTPHTSEIKGAVVVGKKVSKQAVTRNYLKRVARSVVIQKIPYIQPGVYFIVALAPDARAQQYTNIKQHIEHLFSVAGIIKQQTYV